MIFLALVVNLASADVTLKRAQLNASAQNAQNYRGHVYSLGAVTTLAPDWDLGVSGDALDRTYNDGTRITDAFFDLGGVWRAGAHSYWLGDVMTSSTGDIYARTAIALAPHYTFTNHDVGLAVRYNQYRHLRAGIVSPSYFYSVNDTTGFGAAAFVVRTEKFIAAVQATAVLNPFDRHDFRVVGATGRALEDAGIEVRFDSLTFEYGYALRPHWRLQLSYTDYASDVRREHSYGVGLGYR